MRVVDNETELHARAKKGALSTQDRTIAMEIIFRQVKALEDYAKNINEDLREIRETLRAVKKNLRVIKRLP